MVECCLGKAHGFQVRMFEGFAVWEMGALSMRLFKGLAVRQRVVRSLCSHLLWLSLFLPSAVNASTVVVLESKAASYAVGTKLKPDASIQLKAGERLTLIAANGVTVSLRGPYDGMAIKDAEKHPSSDTAKNLSALLASREARTSSVGVVRAGSETAKLPDPWLIDVARAGKRCMLTGAPPKLWREKATQAEAIWVAASDRSWRIDLSWPAGADRIALPDSAPVEGVAGLIIGRQQEEVVLSLSSVPASLDDPALYAAWLLRMGCMQQADALLENLKQAK